MHERTILNKVIKDDSKWMELIRFGIVGTISTVITYGAYYILLYILNPTFSFTIAYIIALIVNFILTTRFTFQVKANTKKGLGFIITNIINYLLSTAFLNLFIYLGVSKRLAPIPMFAICIPTNFLLVKLVMKGKHRGSHLCIF